MAKKWDQNAKKDANKQQKWRVIYVDEYKEEEVKGKYKDFGFFVGRPFYLVSALPLGRVLQVNGGSTLVIHRYVKGRKEQMWYFDKDAKTITSQKYKDRCIEIAGNGTSKQARLASKNSRWW